MHYSTLFQDRQPFPRPLPTGEGETPSQAPPLGAYGVLIVAPLALHTSRFWRSVLRVPYFQCPLLATITVTNMSSRVNEINGEKK